MSQIDLFEMMERRLGKMGVVQSRLLKSLLLQPLEARGVYPAVLRLIFDDGVEMNGTVNQLHCFSPNGASFDHSNYPEASMTAQVTRSPVTIREWAHRFLETCGYRGICRTDEIPTTRTHTYVCDTTSELLMAFGPWWVWFTAANAEANKDQEPQIADKPGRQGETWRLRTQHDRTEVLGPPYMEGGLVLGFSLQGGGWITFDGLRTHWERVPAARAGSCYPACGVPDHAPLDNMPPRPGFERVTGWPDPEDGDLHSDGVGNLYRRTEERSPLLNELAAVINRRSRENESNTPDFLLASFMSDALKAFERATKARDCWYGIAPQPGWRNAQNAAPDQGPTATPAPAAEPVVSNQELRDLAVQAYLNTCQRLKEVGTASEKAMCAEAVLAASRALETIFAATTNATKAGPV